MRSFRCGLISRGELLLLPAGTFHYIYTARTKAVLAVRQCGSAAVRQCCSAAELQCSSAAVQQQCSTSPPQVQEVPRDP